METVRWPKSRFLALLGITGAGVGCVPSVAGNAAILPGSLHYTGRPSQTERKKKPARSGRDDRRAELARGSPSKLKEN
jgi:hypothetical protein